MNRLQTHVIPTHLMLQLDPAETRRRSTQTGETNYET